MARRLAMVLTLLASSLFFLRSLAAPVSGKESVAADGPAYTADGNLLYPTHYREWIFLTSGLDMSYNPSATAPAQSIFDNVFVNPSSYRAFLKTGIWPNSTIFVLENRDGEGNHSINTRGKTQTEEITGMEIHVKDAKGQWAFYSFDSFTEKAVAKRIERPASCYTCHETHAAVDTTFVQFYPTLMPIAKAKTTLSPAFLEESSKPSAAAAK